MSAAELENWARSYEKCQELARVCLQLLEERALTLASAESCTGGLLGAMLTALPGSSQVYRGGVIAYANEVKEGQLAVAGSLLEQYGAVSSEVATAMARGVQSTLQTHIGVATTGIAGPGGACEGKPVGTVWCGFASADSSEALLLQLTGSRTEIRMASVEKVLEALAQFIIKQG